MPRVASNPNLLEVFGNTLYIRRDGTNSPTADINWGDFQIVGLNGLDPDDDADADIGTAALAWQRLFTGFIRPGTGDALVLEEEDGTARFTIAADGDIVANVVTDFDIQIAGTSVLFADVDGIRLNRNVEANTAGTGAPNVLTAAERFKVFTNEGATAQNFHTLPSAAAGLEYKFIVQDVDGMRIVANTGDTIRVGATVSIAAGFIESTAIGSIVTLIAINTTEWMGEITGTWAVETS